MSARLPAFTALALASSLHAEPDLLRFDNGDALHGTFLGCAEDSSILWKREDIAEPIELAIKNVKDVIISAGSPQDSIEAGSVVRLKSGDILPGRILSADGQNLQLETDFAGVLDISRNKIDTIAPSPFGGRLIYQGPFQKDLWKVEGVDRVEHLNIGEAPLPWTLAGGSWYSGNVGDLRGQINLPDRARIQFDIAWKNRLQVGLLFFADFKTDVPPPPENAEEVEEKPERQAQLQIPNTRQSDLPSRFGNALVCNFFGTNADLQHIYYNDQGKGALERLHRSNLNAHFPETGEAHFDFRIDKPNGRVMLFVDGEFGFQWQSGDFRMPSSGTDFGIYRLAGNSKVKLSDLTVTDWHGMPDSARSMKHEERDITLLTNGTDRFAGQLSHIQDSVVHVDGSYARFTIPLEDVAEIHLAGNEPTLERDYLPAQSSRLSFRPYGTITGKLGESTPEHLTFRSPVLGKLRIKRSTVALYDFQPEITIRAPWDEPF